MTVYQAINALVGYGLKTGLIESEDTVYTQNRLLELFHLDSFEESDEVSAVPSEEIFNLEVILRELLDFAAENGLFADEGTVQRDLFDTKIMSCLLSRPSEIEKKFLSLYQRTAKDATDWFFKFCQDSDYIRRYRICKDIKWKTSTEYGDLDISINLSNPEKDSKTLEALNKTPQSSYPKCILCSENVGYAGRVDHAACQTLRVIPIKLAGREWGFRYSPYAYFDEHCIVFSKEHTSMKISHETFISLFDFVKLFPHYTIGSDGDLPLVSGSVLSHNHFLGGNYEFPISNADIEDNVIVHGFDDVRCGILKWPLSVLRLSGRNSDRIVQLADKILLQWREYTDKDAFICAHTNGKDHNTIAPVVRKRSGGYELDLILRNNMITAEHPQGVFNPHENVHHITKENIGLIESMGFAVLPSRLKKELSDLANDIIQKKNLEQNAELSKHAEWIKEILSSYSDITKENIGGILKEETGRVFALGLEDAGVFKRTKEGRNAFRKFIRTFA